MAERAELDRILAAVDPVPDDALAAAFDRAFDPAVIDEVVRADAESDVDDARMRADADADARAESDARADADARAESDVASSPVSAPSPIRRRSRLPRTRRRRSAFVAAMMFVVAASGATFAAGAARDRGEDTIADGRPTQPMIAPPTSEPTPPGPPIPAAPTTVADGVEPSLVPPIESDDGPGPPRDAAPPRDPRLHPFPWDSPWNLPIGDAARYVPAGLEPPTVPGSAVDEAILVLEPDAALHPVRRTLTEWGSGPPRCEAVGEGAQFDGQPVPVPDGFTTEAHLDRYPGHPGAILAADGRTVFQTQPLHVCGDGLVVSRFDAPSVDLLTGDGLRGAHGGSGLSSLGGTIRVHEIIEGRIDHALKLSIDGTRYLSPDGGGYRWPADRADRDALDPDSVRCRYGGSVPALQMGALLALPPDFDVDALATPFAKIVATALQDYGGYVVANACRHTFALTTEWGPDGRVVDEVRARHGIDLAAVPVVGCGTDEPSCRYATDMARIVEALHVVDDNGPSSPGGAGTRRVPCAQPFADGSGGPPLGGICRRS